MLSLDRAAEPLSVKIPCLRGKIPCQAQKIPCFIE
jgi:hypothetical protein